MMLVNEKLEWSDIMEMMPSKSPEEIEAAVAREEAERQELLDQIRNLIISKGTAIRLTGLYEDDEVSVTMKELQEAIDMADNSDLRDLVRTHTIWGTDSGMIIRID